MLIKYHALFNFINFIFFQIFSKLTSYSKELYLLLLFGSDPLYSNFILSFTIAVTLPQFISSTIYYSLLREVSDNKGEFNLFKLEKETFPKIFLISILSFIFVKIGGHSNTLDSLFLAFLSFPTIYIQIYTSILDSKLKNKYILFEIILPITILITIGITRKISLLALFYFIGTLIVAFAMRIDTLHWTQTNSVFKNENIDKGVKLRFKSFELISHAFIQSFNYLILIIDYEFLSRVSNTEVPIYSFIQKNILIISSLLAYPVCRLVIAKTDKLKVILKDNKSKIFIALSTFVFLVLILFNYSSNIFIVFQDIFKNRTFEIDVEVVRYGLVISILYFCLRVLIAYSTKIKISSQAAICMAISLVIKVMIVNASFNNLNILKLMQTNLLYYSLSIFLIIIISRRKINSLRSF